MIDLSASRDIRGSGYRASGIPDGRVRVAHPTARLPGDVVDVRRDGKTGGKKRGGRRSGRGGTWRPPVGVPLPDSRGGTVRVPRIAGVMRAVPELLSAGQGVHPLRPDASVAHAVASPASFTATIGV
ncbi:hypothetical protein GCM10018783_64030 [Streptomyces griseosporeus]|nr:hypothetical protein GCM10018783_64030 [Streptomyces griseosporeus]